VGTEPLLSTLLGPVKVGDRVAVVAGSPVEVRGIGVGVGELVIAASNG
jgi:hypothetical protein